MPRMLLKGDEKALQDWVRQAMKDQTVWPYFGGIKYCPIPELKEDDWQHVLLLDETETGLMKLAPDREGVTLHCSIWVLDAEKRPDGSGVASGSCSVVRAALREGLSPGRLSRKQRAEHGDAPEDFRRTVREIRGRRLESPDWQVGDAVRVSWAS